MGGEERRNQERVPKEVLIRYRCVGPDELKEPEFVVALLRDISRGGLEMKTRKEYPINSILEVRIPMTDLTAARTVNGAVRWMKPAEEDGQFLVGVKFVRLKKKTSG